jgi:hypothetical protein
MYPSDCIQRSFPPYTLVKYPADKKHDPSYASYRSRIYKGNDLVCSAPSKSIPFDTFRELYRLDECIVEEFVEGVMINMFYDDGWKIATRSTVGAECTFDSDRTFASLFQDCEVPYEEMNIDCFYSFVMQHPEHAIVHPVSKPTLYCVSIFGNHLSIFLTPRRFTFSSYEEAIEKAQEGTWKGLVIKCNGVRTKIRNNRHVELDALKLNMPFKERYFAMRGTPAYKTYLAHYPDKEKGMELEKRFQATCQHLYQSYRDCFIYKLYSAKEHSFKDALYDLHGIYLQELYPRSMYRKRVEEYVLKHLKIVG